MPRCARRATGAAVAEPSAWRVGIVSVGWQGTGSDRVQPTAVTYLPIAPNLLARRFVAAAPNRILLADITDVATSSE